jgi:hypothetical protein
MSQSRDPTTRYAFLQILHSLGQARRFVDILLRAVEGIPEYELLTPQSHPTVLALHYLYLQGADKFEIGGVTYPVLTTLMALQEPWVLPPQLTAVEQCAACCQPPTPTNTLLRLVTPPPPPASVSCPWFNVSNLTTGPAAEGAYKLQNYTIFDRPVWKQDPGTYFVYFLASACFSPKSCGGLQLNETELLRGPAWVIGPRLGGQNFSFYALNPYNMHPSQLKGSYDLTFAPPSMPADEVDVNDTFVPMWRKPVDDITGNETLVEQELHLLCMQAPFYRNATTGVTFADPQAHRKLSIPDASGSLVSTGNLQDITAMGVLVSPILAANSPSHVTRIKFGVGWQTVTVKSGVNDAFNMERVSGGFTYCTIPKLSCLLPHMISTTADAMPGCPMPLPNTTVFRGCFHEGDRRIGNGQYALDALIIPHADGDRCSSIYPTDLYYNTSTREWEKQKFNSDNYRLYNIDPAIGSRVILDDWSGKYWKVKSVNKICREDPLGDIPDTVCERSRNPVFITSGYTSFRRYVVCHRDETDHEETMPAEIYPIGAQSYSISRLHTPIVLTTNRTFVVRMLNNTWAGVKSLRIGTEIFGVVSGASDVTGFSLELSRTNSNVSTHSAYPVGTLVYGLQGAAWNVASNLSMRVPEGVYSLENMTAYINSNIKGVLTGRDASLSLTLREPKEGLCGEVPHGVSYSSERFHCTGASRYFQLTGKVYATESTGPSNHIKVLNTSSLLPSLGIASPVHAYVFSHVQTTRAVTSTRVQYHPKFPGAGYISSGYGRQSGLGLGGEDMWHNFMPPTTADGTPSASEGARQPKTFWCGAGYGYVCATEDCPCRVAVVVNNEMVLGATMTQNGGMPQDNTLVMPAASSGILVSTGNLEDVGLDSSAATSLSIDALREHSTAIAARVHGKIEFGRCNNMFGADAARCSLSSSLENGIALTDSGQLPVHMYWNTTLWVAVKTLPGDGMETATNNRNDAEFWRLIALNKDAFLRSFSSLQDQTSMHVAGRVCTDYCDTAVTARKVLAQQTIIRVSDLLDMFNTSVKRLATDTTKYCAAIRCPGLTPIVEWSLDTQLAGNATALGVCSTACSRLDPPGTCACSRNLTCAEIWGKRPVTYVGNEDVWDRCIKLMEYDAQVMPLSGAAGVAKLERARAARANYTVYIENPNLQTELAIAVDEARFSCACAHVPGDSVDVRESVISHACPFETVPMLDMYGRIAVPQVNITAQVCTSSDVNALNNSRNGTSSISVLKFERSVTSPSEAGLVHTLTLPSATGILLTTGNLYSLTSESGSMTSTHVKENSTFIDDVWIGAVGKSAESRGSRMRTNGRTSVNTDVTVACEGSTVAGSDDVCRDPSLVVGIHGRNVTVQDVTGAFGGVTMLSFAEVAGDWKIAFPAWDDNLCAKDQGTHNCNPRNMNSGAETARMSGNIITTGNLGDVTYISPNFIKGTGGAAFDGAVEIGSSYDCTTGKYWRAGWSFFSQAECAEVQRDVAWNATTVLFIDSAACKKACEMDPACGVAVVNTTLDRRQLAPACMLFQRRATTCTVRPNPTQDLYLLVREAAGPWLVEEGNASFFEPLCQAVSNNMSMIPASEIKMEGFIHGGMMWRPGQPLTWTVGGASVVLCCVVCVYAKCMMWRPAQPLTWTVVYAKCMVWMGGLYICLHRCMCTYMHM